MGRKSLVDRKVESGIDGKRKSAIEKFFGLTDKVLKHIEWSLDATRPCTACVFVENVFKPGKAKSEDGKCAMCFNTGVVPDTNQRNWATGEIADRVAPKPKAVELSADKSDERNEIERELQGLDNASLDAQLTAMGVITIAEDEKA